MEVEVAEEFHSLLAPWCYIFFILIRADEIADIGVPHGEEHSSLQHYAAPHTLVEPLGVIEQQRIAKLGCALMAHRRVVDSVIYQPIGDGQDVIAVLQCLVDKRLLLVEDIALVEPAYLVIELPGVEPAWSGNGEPGDELPALFLITLPDAAEKIIIQISHPVKVGTILREELQVAAAELAIGMFGDKTYKTSDAFRFQFIVSCQRFNPHTMTCPDASVEVGTGAGVLWCGDESGLNRESTLVVLNPSSDYLNSVVA